MRIRTFMKSAVAAAVALSAVTTAATSSFAATRHHHSSGYAYSAPSYRQIHHPGILQPMPRTNLSSRSAALHPSPALERAGSTPRADHLHGQGLRRPTAVDGLVAAVRGDRPAGGRGADPLPRRRPPPARPQSPRHSIQI